VTEKRSTGWAPAAIAAVLLLIAAVLCFGLSASFKATGRHAYNSSHPASTVALTAGKQYQLSVRGGRSALTARGLSADQPQCSWSTGNSVAQSVTVSPLPADTRSVNVVATFVAPTTARLHINCATWGAVFVDDSDNSAFDRAGLFLLLGIIALTCGLALGLATLYRRSAASVP
jgi:hypothetical protein